MGRLTDVVDGILQILEVGEVVEEIQALRLPVEPCSPGIKTAVMPVERVMLGDW